MARVDSGRAEERAAARSRAVVTALTALTSLATVVSAGATHPRTAFGQPAAQAPQFGATATVEHSIASRNSEDATAAGLEVDLEDRGIALETLSEALLEVPGAHSVDGGAYGAFSSLSLRGNQLGHTIWVLGDVPLNSPDSGAFDMSTLPLSLLSSLEIYRGGAPLWLSQGAIGGVVRVMPAQARGTDASVSLGVGSFGRRELQVSSQVRRGGVELRAGVTAAHADNDYTYQDDGLAFDGGSDDAERRMRNADVTEGSGLVHLRVAAGPGHVDVIALGNERIGGVPGPGGAYNTRDTHRTYARGFMALAYTQEARRGQGAGGRRVHRLQFSGSVRGETNRFQDPLQEFGLNARNRDSRSTWWRSTLRAAASRSPRRWLELTAVGSYAGDRFSQEVPHGGVDVPDSGRQTGAAGGEVRLMGKGLGMPAELRASVRGELSRAHIEAPVVGAEDGFEGFERHHLSPTLRVAGAVEPYRGLALRASWSDGTRLPSILELFGDGGFLRGNGGSLRPEHGRSVDAGVVLTGQTGRWTAALESNAFLQKVDDLILWRNTSQFEFVADNQGSATIQGVEFGLSVQLARLLQLVGSATLLQARNDELDTQLPRRPKAAFYLRPTVSLPLPVALWPLGVLAVFSTLDYQSTFFHDRANLRLQQQRFLLGAGGSITAFGERVALLVRATNLLDTHTQDFFQLPLPGRAYAALVTYREEL